MKSPFKFLDAFTLKDKDAFFGRDQEIDTLYNTVFKTPILLVYGWSGTGKTSLVQCGLASRFDGPDWYPIPIRRNANINESTNAELRKALGTMAKDNLTENVSLLLRKNLRPVYLIFDQFEELFIFGKEEEQKIFMTSLRALLDAQLPSKIILIMREDNIGQLYDYETLIPELSDHRFRVEPMGPTKVKHVISSSFEKFNIQLAEPKEELLDIMVHNINDPQSGILLPYLQLYLDMLYRDKYNKQYGQTETEGQPKIDITKSDIERIGRIDNVLERFLEDQTRELRVELVKKYKIVKPNIIQEVLDVFVSEKGTKRPVAYKETGDTIVLAEEAAITLKDIPAPILTDILKTLHQDRILRRGNENFELAHDSLALVIDRQRSQSQRQLQNIKKRLLNGYEEYQKTGTFLNQKQLASFEEYLPQLGLTKEIQQFLNKCEVEVIRQADEDKDRLQQETRMAQQKKLARARGILLTIAAVLAGLAALMAVRFKMQGNTLADNIFISDSLRLETDQLYTKMVFESDSIKNVINQVDKLITKLDTMAEAEKAVDGIELTKVVISLKSVIRNDTMSDAEMATRYITLKDIFVTGILSKGELLPKAKRDTVFQSPKVNVVLQVKTPRKKIDFIEVKWLKGNGEIVGDPMYVSVYPLNLEDDSLQWIKVPSTLAEPGDYRVNITNSSGRLIGYSDFTREESTSTESPPTETSVSNKGELYVIEFRTMASGSLNSPGKETNTFKTGQMIHYWFRINSPKAGDEISVILIGPNGVPVWNDKIKTAVNTDKGFRGHGYHGARTPGKYTIKITNKKAEKLAEHEIIIE